MPVNVLKSTTNSTTPHMNKALLLSILSEENQLKVWTIAISLIAMVMVLSNSAYLIARFKYGKFGGKLYQQHPPSRCLFTCLLVCVLIIWIIYALVLTLFIYDGIEILKRNAFIDHQNDNNNSMTSFDNIDPQSLTNIISIVFSSVGVFLSMVLIIVMGAVTMGTFTFRRSHHPLDRGKVSHHAGRALILIHVVFVCVAPMLLLIALFGFLYSACYYRLCSLGNVHVDNTIAKNNSIFVSCNEIAHYLDLEWISLIVISLMSPIMAAFLSAIAKFFLQMQTEHYYVNSVDAKENSKEIDDDVIRL